MKRTIEWKRTGGKTHLVTITDYVTVVRNPYANIPNDLGFLASLGQANPVHQSNALQNAANNFPSSAAGASGNLGGILGGIL